MFNFEKARCALVTVLATLMLAAPSVNAAKGGDGLSGTIELGQPAGLRLASTDSGTYYGDAVPFRTTVDGRLSSKSFVYIRVICRQGASVVYQYSSRDLDFAFPLEDQAGLEWDGGNADCTAELMHYEPKGRSAVISTLDVTSFFVAGN
jgi:hypothetical protein